MAAKITWTRQMDVFLIRNWDRYKPSFLAQKLGLRNEQIIRRARKLGLYGDEISGGQ